MKEKSSTSRTWIRGLLSVKDFENNKVWEVYVQGLQKYIPLENEIVSRLGHITMEKLKGKYNFWVVESVNYSFDSSKVVNILDSRIKKLY
jgi:hypothetical protein